MSGTLILTVDMAVMSNTVLFFQRLLTHFRGNNHVFAVVSCVLTILAGALDSLSEEAEPLGLRVPWINTKVQAFGEILDATVESIPV